MSISRRKLKQTPAGIPVSGLEDHLGYWLRLVSNHVSHAFKVKVERHGVTVAEWVVMRALFDAGTVRPSTLAEGVGLSRGAISKLLDRLAAKDLTATRADAEDARAQLVTLTASGRRLVPRLAAIADENDAQMFGHLDAGQKARLRALLRETVKQHGLNAAPIE